MSNHIGQDLSMLGRSLDSVIIVDNSPQCYSLQPSNAIAVASWFQNPIDRELFEMIPLLERLYRLESVYELLDPGTHWKRLLEQERENSEDSAAISALKRRRERIKRVGCYLMDEFNEELTLCFGDRCRVGIGLHDNWNYIILGTHLLRLVVKLMPHKTSNQCSKQFPFGRDGGAPVGQLISASRAPWVKCRHRVQPTVAGFPGKPANMGHYGRARQHKLGDTSGNLA
jgi:hypothetical protein